MARTGNRTSRRSPLNMRTTDEMRAKLEAAAEAAGRNLTQEVEWRIEQSFEWQAAFGEAREWLQREQEKIARITRETVRAELHRFGWQVMHTPKGDVWAEPGVYTGPQSGFVDMSARDAPTAAPQPSPEIESVVERAVVSALRKTLAPRLLAEGSTDPTHPA